jgi:hypothetical protein
MRSVSYQKKVNDEFFSELLVITANAITNFIQNLLTTLCSSIFMCLVLPNSVPVCGSQTSWNCHMRLRVKFGHPFCIRKIFSTINAWRIERTGWSSSNCLVLYLRGTRFESGLGYRLSWLRLIEVFSQSLLQERAWILPEQGHCRFVPVPLKYTCHPTSRGARGCAVGWALCYKPEGRGFESRWGHWILQLTQPFQPHYGPGVDSASNRIEYH